MKTIAKSDSSTVATVAWSLWEDEMRHDDKLAADLIRAQLGRILKSPIFSLSTRLSRFLRFVVETSLDNQGDSLKEYVIGAEVYDRRPPYHPSHDSIVRTEARRLRMKLKEYYESEGKWDPIFIYFRTGSYAPAFFSREAQSAEKVLRKSMEETALSDHSDLFVSVIPFEDVSGNLLARDCARAITDDLRHQLTMMEGCQVTDTRPSLHCEDHGGSTQNMSSNEIHLMFQGTVASDDRHLRITSRLTDWNGNHFWSQQFDLEIERGCVLELTRRLACAVVSRTRIQGLVVQCGLTAEKTRARNRLNSSILASEASMDQDQSADWRKIRSRFEAIQHTTSVDPRIQTDIARCFIEEALSGTSNPEHNIQCAKRAILLALQTDSQYSEAHSCLGYLLALEGNVPAATDRFGNSWAFDSTAEGARQYALLLAALDRFDDAWHYLRKAEMIDPFSSRHKATRIKMLYWNRKYEDLVNEHNRPLVYGVPPLESQVFVALACLEIGLVDQARHLAHNLRREGIVRPYRMASASEIFARCGDVEQSQQIAEQYRFFSAESPISKFRQASLAAALGRRSLALGAITAVLKDGEPEGLWLSVDPRFDAFRETSEPRTKRSSLITVS